MSNGEYLLVIIDEYSRYPEVEFVRSTSAQAVIPHLDRVFSTHRFPEMAKTDGGPPFNGHEYHQYMQWAGIHTVVVSPEDPEANGLAENFMKAMKKVWNIANIEKKATNKSSTNSLDTTSLHPTVQQRKHLLMSYLTENFKFDCRKKTTRPQTPR